MCLAFLLVLGACGGEQADTAVDDAAAVAAESTEPPRDACALLTAADVTAVLGEQARDSLALDMPGGGAPATLSQCNYAVGTNVAAASLLLRRPAEGEDPQAASEGARQSLTEAGVAIEEVPDLAQVAFWGGNQLHVFTSGGWHLVVSPVPAGGLEQARALAERALAKL
jgi:hypothetical protein